MGFSYKNKLRELGFFNQGKRRLQEDLRAACQYLKGTFKKAREGLCTRINSNGAGQNSFKLKEHRFKLYIKDTVPYEDSGTLEQVAQRSYECPIPGTAQDEVGQGFEQSDLVGGVLPRCWK